MGKRNVKNHLYQLTLCDSDYILLNIAHSVHLIIIGKTEGEQMKTAGVVFGAASVYCFSVYLHYTAIIRLGDAIHNVLVRTSIS